MSQQQVYKYITLQNLKVFLEQLQSSYSATPDKFGGIKIGFPESSTPVNGQIEIPVKLSGEGQAFVSVPYREFEITPATKTELGGVKISDNKYNALEIQDDGSLSLNIDDKTLSHTQNWIQLGKDISWTLNESINEYNYQGIYNLSGISTGLDGLPISGGCQFNARLSVFETKTRTDYTCVTQLLVISSINKNVAGDVYIRTSSFKGNNAGNLWGGVKWSKLQPIHMLGNGHPDNCIENGFHEGFHNENDVTKPFTILVVEGLKDSGTKCQFKFSTDSKGNPELQQRKMTYDGQNWEVGDWEDVVQQEEQQIPVANGYKRGGVQIGEGIITSNDDNGEPAVINISHSDANTLYQINKILVKNTTTAVNLDPRKYNVLEHEDGVGFENVTINQISTTNMLDRDYVAKESGEFVCPRMTEFGFQFLASDKGCTLTYPAGIKWANGISPIIKPNDLIEIRFTYTPNQNILASWTKYV